MQKGTINVQTENIFPIIKKFLYSDQEIFLRELVANAIDATSKLKTLASRGEVGGELGGMNIEIILDESAKTLTISDKGIGMTSEEVIRYLSEVALSSAKEFLEKYQGETNIIGHFGLGFYSAFMVASKVEVFTKSWQGGPATHWICEGEPAYEIGECDKDTRGTDIVLHISDESSEFLDRHRIDELLNKYCRFLPIEIQFGTKSKTVETDEFDEEGDKKTVTEEVPNIINNPHPIWKKQPLELKEEDYLAFYEELHPHSPSPLFWIHLNIDYPFNLTGVLYFPPPGNSYEVQKNKIQLYSNQVFVTDNVKDIVPEFLTLLHGVIDSPDIPLNVSRSYLQSDRNVKRITDYITKKVADKLEEMFRQEREKFAEKWELMKVFVKYGMLTEDKFFERGKKFFLLENTEHQLFTEDEYREKVQALQTDKDGKLIHLYTTDIITHDAYIKACQNLGYDVLVFDHPMIDPHFLQKLEQSLDKVSFVRVDSDTPDHLIKKDEKRESVLSEEEQKTLEELFKTGIKGSEGRVELKALSPEDMPVVITKPEFLRRMREMYAMQGDRSNFPDSYNVVVNTNHPIFTHKLLTLDSQEKQAALVSHLYDLARLQQGMLQGSELTEFVKRQVLSYE